MTIGRNIWLMIAGILLTVFLVVAMLMFGQVKIPFREVLTIIAGGTTSTPAWGTIVLESRLPMALTALLAGAALSASGLLLQTTFRNPLAGPSVLGISAGASLGVAVVMLTLSGMEGIDATLREAGTFLGAVVGAGAILGVLALFSAMLRNNLSLLIIGIMVSYLASAIISILNTLAPAEAVRSFVIWGLGSYAGVSLNDLPLFATVTLLLTLVAIPLAKPLNAMLLGDRYLHTMGYRVTTLRTSVMALAGALAAAVTAWCGPIGFIGLIVPHVARMIFDTSNHHILIPATILTGACVSLGCALVSVLPLTAGVLPINAVTPIAGVPVIIYIMLNTKRLKYFN